MTNFPSNLHCYSPVPIGSSDHFPIKAYIPLGSSNLAKAHVPFDSEYGAINRTFSSSLSLEAGIPQGSDLGPVLLLMSINDLSHALGTPLFLFADDYIVSYSTFIPLASAKPTAAVTADLEIITLCPSILENLSLTISLEI